jgi:hypothetical protein
MTGHKNKIGQEEIVYIDLLNVVVECLFFFDFLGGMERLEHKLSAEPFILWCEVPAGDTENRHSPEDHASLQSN